MKNILRKPKDSIEIPEGRYQDFNLTENPFPITPAVNKDNQDIRYNGNIYEGKIREDEQSKIEENFLKVSQKDPNHLRLGYILDTSYVGRGNGKSAFSINLLKKINEDFCLDVSDEKNKCFGLSITPEPSGRTKTFYSFIDLFFESILDSNIIQYCLASLRLNSIINLRPDFDIDSKFDDEEDLILKLNDIEWFRKEKINIAELTRNIFLNENLGSLSSGFPLNRDRVQFQGMSLVKNKNFESFYFNTLKKGRERLNFIFTDLVNFFLASGFNGAYIIVDDFERIPDFQSDRQKREFALELRSNLFDGITKNAKIGFFNFIFILHAGVPRLIEKAWSDTGMEQRSPLSPDNYNSSHVIVFNKLTHNDAILLIKKYLAEFRIKDESNSLKPFDEDSIALISEKAELNAAGILEKSHQLIEKAIDEKISSIDKGFVEKIFGDAKKNNEPSGDDFSNEKSVDLFEKAKKK